MSSRDSNITILSDLIYSALRTIYDIEVANVENGELVTEWVVDCTLPMQYMFDIKKLREKDSKTVDETLEKLFSTRLKSSLWDKIAKGIWSRKVFPPFREGKKLEELAVLQYSIFPLGIEFHFVFPSEGTSGFGYNYMLPNESLALTLTEEQIET